MQLLENALDGHGRRLPVFNIARRDRDHCHRFPPDCLTWRGSRSLLHMNSSLVGKSPGTALMVIDAVAEIRVRVRAARQAEAEGEEEL